MYILYIILPISFCSRFIWLFSHLFRCAVGSTTVSIWCLVYAYLAQTWMWKKLMQPAVFIFKDFVLTGCHLNPSSSLWLPADVPSRRTCDLLLHFFCCEFCLSILRRNTFCWNRCTSSSESVIVFRRWVHFPSSFPFLKLAVFLAWLEACQLCGKLMQFLALCAQCRHINRCM